MRRTGRIALWVLVGMLGLVAVGIALASDPRPEGTPGPEADALARRMLTAVGGDAWRRLGAVQFDFDGRRQLLWDRRHHRVEVRWDDMRVVRRLDTERGAVAERAGAPLSGAERDAAVRRAYEIWANDSFWLNPVEKLFDTGVTRKIWHGPDREVGLIAHYASGGVTPGDTYLWLLDQDVRPRAWRMWVQIIPVGGVEASWEGWQQLPGGAWVATEHAMAGRTLQLRNVRAADTVAELTGGTDPFAALP